MDGEAHEPVGILHGDDAARHDLAGAQLPVRQPLDIRVDLPVLPGSRRRDEPAFLGQVIAERIGVAEFERLFGEVLPQGPAAAQIMGDGSGLVVGALRGAFGDRAVRHEYQIVFSQLDLGGLAVFLGEQLAGYLVSAREIDRDIRDPDTVLETNALVLQKRNKGLHEGFVLVVPRELERSEIGEPFDVVYEAHDVAAHLDRRVPAFEREHRAPVQPEVRFEELVAEHVFDAFALKRVLRGHPELDEFFLGLLRQREIPVVFGALAAVADDAAVGRVRIVVVEPVELVEHRCALDFQRRNRAEQVPQAFEMVLHLAPAAGNEAVGGHGFTV